MIKVYPPVENVQKIRLKAGDTILSAALRPDQTWSVIVLKADGGLQTVKRGEWKVT